MRKQDFLDLLRQKLSGLPEEDIGERLSFYGEMIDDRMEEGMTEEEAVSAVGSVDEIVSQIVSETPIAKLVKERIKPKRSLAAWEIVLLVLGFPLWFPLLIAAFSVLLSVYITIWSVILSLWVVFVSLGASALGCVAAGVICLCKGGTVTGLVLLSAAAVLAGLTIFMFFACRAVTKGAAVLTKKIALWIKSLFLRKEETK
ncbi:MAG: DUF1700 domain-containing protein [Clostridia bacterium]|nr:DUF1700 domain-containing protein [Clostridia bacterium]